MSGISHAVRTQRCFNVHEVGPTSYIYVTMTSRFTFFIILSLELSYLGAPRETFCQNS